MPKVFPASFLPAAATAKGSKAATTGAGSSVEAAEDVTVLTVWRKSLLFNCSGFTVFDGRGNLVYRVDNYLAGNKGEIVLMDADGKPILTMRRKRLSLGECWTVYDGEKKADPRFSVHRKFNLQRSKTLANVRSCKATSCSASPFSSPDSSPSLSPENHVAYKMEGSYKKRSVSVYDGARRCVAEIRRKESASGVALGGDVFRLMVARPYTDTATAMALVVLLDQMCRSSTTLLSC